MTRPVVLLALGVVGLGMTATVRVSQTTAPEGWATTDARAVPADPRTESGRHRMQWTADGGERFVLRCPVGGHEVGEIVPIAYNPSVPEEYKPLVVDRMWLVGVLGATSAILLVTGMVSLSRPREPVPRHATSRRRAIL